jgi:hypothetical protein
MAFYLPQTLEDLVSRGMNITIEGGQYLPQTLIRLVTIARRTGAHVTIAGGNYLPNTLSQIADAGGNNVTFVVGPKK